MDNQINDIVTWLREQVKNAGVKGLVVGVSGGIDSAVVASLIKRAFPDDSLGVILPISSKKSSAEDAQTLVEAIDLDHLTVDLTETHQTMYEQITAQTKNTQSFNQDKDQLANANLRARLRMSTLYALATNYNYLVVGTDNAAEWHTGYFTKYGDGGADILPLVEFTKGEVREMAKYLNVPEAIVNKKPSADLWEGQTDEDEMGITYDTIDAYLKGENVSESDKEKIDAMHKATAHKRDPLPQFNRK